MTAGGKAWSMDSVLPLNLCPDSGSRAQGCYIDRQAGSLNPFFKRHS